ncbi:UDP-glucose 4-epimerase GalE, partial [bacterium]|nr:UDP-glucose 4-epimerase GalE [bacterium]
GAGYIGSHTVINFVNNGYDVVIFDNLETGHTEIVEELKKLGNVEFEKGDLRNIKDINKVFEKYSIDAVIHFAAFALVGESVENPAKYYRNNVYGTLNLLDSMVAHNVKKIVFSSTCATYGEPKYTPIDENHPQNPINPYGNSKLCVEYMLKDYDTAYGLKSIRLRYFNVAGCDEQSRVGEWHDIETHLIPNILKSTFGESQTFKIFGDDYETPDGTCIRDYVNVEDLAQAHRLAYLYLKENNKSNVFNLGTEQGDSVKQVFDTCEKVLQKTIPVEIVERRAGDPAKLYANANKAKSILKWTPERTLEKSIKTAYDWECKLNKIKADN